MVDDAGDRIGLDIDNGTLRVAWLRRDPENFRVEAVEIVDLGDPGLTDWLQLAPTFVAVPDEFVMARHFKLDHQGVTDAAIAFELALGLTGKPEEYCFDLLPGEPSHCGLSFIVRRQVLRDIVAPIAPDLHPDSVDRLNFQPRAVALGKAFRQFCLPEPESFICLAHVQTDATSLCLLYEGQIIEVGGVKNGLGQLCSTGDCNRLAAKLSSVVNSKLDALGENGRPLGPLRLLVTGVSSDDKVVYSLRSYFPSAGRPRLDPAAVAGSDCGQGYDITSFLAAIGAALD